MTFHILHTGAAFPQCDKACAFQDVQLDWKAFHIVYTCAAFLQCEWTYACSNGLFDEMIFRIADSCTSFLFHGWACVWEGWLHLQMSLDTDHKTFHWPSFQPRTFLIEVVKQIENLVGPKLSMHGLSDLKSSFYFLKKRMSKFLFFWVHMRRQAYIQ